MRHTKIIKWESLLWIAAVVYACVLFWMNFRLIHDGNFWGDEIFSIKLSKMSLTNMLIATANDVHPPLYYIILMLLRWILGDHAETFHGASLAAYILVLITALTFVWKKWGGNALLF